MGDPHWSSEGLHPMEEAHVAVVHEELQPMGRIQLKKLMEYCLPWEGPGTGTWEGVILLRRKKCVSQCVTICLTPIPAPGHH